MGLPSYVKRLECKWKIIGKRMEFDEKDYEVISLLSKLKEADSAYPVEMIASRRKSFVKQIAAMGLGAGAAFALKEGAKAAGGSSIPPIAGTIVETALIVAIVAEAGFVAFVNREKVLDLFRTNSSQQTVEQVTAPPDLSLPLPDPTEIIYTAFIESAEPTIVTETPTVVGTPSPEMSVVTAAAGVEESEDGGVQVNSTPDPNNNNGNNGNHYGQTPVAERTKDSNGGGGSDDNNENNDNRDNGNRRGR